MFLFKVVLFLSVYRNHCSGVPRHIGKEFQNVRKLQAIVTDGELSTAPSADPTTENAECPSDKSLFSKNDIKDIITQFSTGLDIFKSMEDHVVPQAKDINQKHMEDLKQFESWFFNQPEHLIHVLEGLSAVRKKIIEPETQKVAVILKDYPQAKKNIDEKQLNFDELNEKLTKYEHICKYSCEHHGIELNHVFKRSIPVEEKRVCTSIEDLQNQITEELKENFDVFFNKTKEKLFIKNQTLTEKIDKFKVDLKERALKEFGHTMYSVLYLEDQYQHLVKDMNATNTQIVMYAVKDLGLQIDSKLLELEILIEEYGNHCKSCIQGPVKQSVRHKKSVINVNQKSSIVHELIKNKSSEYEMDLNKKIDEIFKDLDESLNDPARKEAYLSTLKLKIKQIKEIEDIERQALEHLKSVASPDSVKKLLDLASISEDLLKNINDKIALLKKITP